MEILPKIGNIIDDLVNQWLKIAERDLLTAKQGLDLRVGKMIPLFRIDPGIEIFNI